MARLLEYGCNCFGLGFQGRHCITGNPDVVPSFQRKQIAELADTDEQMLRLDELVLSARRFVGGSPPSVVKSDGEIRRGHCF
jgi:hypothetical protein